MKLLASCILVLCAVAFIEAQTCAPVFPPTCTGIRDDGRSQCGKNRACLGGTCKGVTSASCSSNSHCYTNFNCVGCTCQHNGVTDTNGIINQLWSTLGVPANTACPLGRKGIYNEDFSERVQCDYPVTGGQQRTWITPGLENAVCNHPSVPSYFDTGKITCSSRYGYACVNGRCINQCDAVAQRPSCSMSTPTCLVNGGMGVCVLDKDAQYRCFPMMAPAACKVDWDCPNGFSCNNCTCVGDSSSGYGFGDRCFTYRLDEIFGKVLSCQNTGYGATCQTIPGQCSKEFVLGRLTSNTTIIDKIWTEIVSPDAENYGTCGLAYSVSRWCQRNW